MPNKDDRTALEEAIRKNDEYQIRMFLQRDDAKELLLMKDDYGYLPIHDACLNQVDKACLRIILDTAVQHGVAKEMLEEKTRRNDWTCLHLACRRERCPESDFPNDSLRLLLEYLSKYVDIKRMLEEKENDDQTCLHYYACKENLSLDSLRLLISFVPSKHLLATMLDARDYQNLTPVDRAKNDKVKQLLQDSDCFEKCRLWLFLNHQDTFLHSLHPNSFDQGCDALNEFMKNDLQQSQQQLTIMLIAFMSSPSKFREAVNETDSSAPMSSYFDVVKKGDQKSDYNHWRKNNRLFREFYGQWPPSERKTASTYEGEGSSSCSIQ